MFHVILYANSKAELIIQIKNGLTINFDVGEIGILRL